MSDLQKIDIRIYTFFTLAGRENQKPDPDEDVIDACEYAMELLQEKRAELVTPKEVSEGI